jgi:hypothetical protein
MGKHDAVIKALADYFGWEVKSEQSTEIRLSLEAVERETLGRAIAIADEARTQSTDLATANPWNAAVMHYKNRLVSIQVTSVPLPGAEARTTGVDSHPQAGNGVASEVTPGPSSTSKDKPPTVGDYIDTTACASCGALKEHWFCEPGSTTQTAEQADECAYCGCNTPNCGLKVTIGEQAETANCIHPQHICRCGEFLIAGGLVSIADQPPASTLAGAQLLGYRRGLEEAALVAERYWCKREGTCVGIHSVLKKMAEQVSRPVVEGEKK